MRTMTRRAFVAAAAKVAAIVGIPGSAFASHNPGHKTAVGYGRVVFAELEVPATAAPHPGFVAGQIDGELPQLDQMEE